MAKKYDNDFKVMLVELLKSGRKAKSLSEECGVNDGITIFKKSGAAYIKIIHLLFFTINPLSNKVYPLNTI
ncbi:hypothetical protein [Tenacibaculum maritimum]|uniref:hypothetical protein n=1 Tax=Tenacibaculum maritimum TaxID=107401 RepID=UPI0012E68E50|nr:hypothetical protein [Tenacibaculum maritimum]MCD9586205.1 hypothetical protein [Tenacibaculum maritimum]MCD9612269.1 hypothetical protein [Tenacibaculum maritimum]MCD9622177.1 hypothetical protein [Tenacibaculum maritimum]MCD9628589.1 hypothetical protein [Tenacibaculum maritimum]MCD9631478.1 hypothetical protein [Tenacibaculum maritimum]